MRIELEIKFLFVELESVYEAIESHMMILRLLL
jgi:hypothetical protein